MNHVSLQEIIERVNEKGESPLDVAASYGISRDTLRRRFKEPTGLLLITRRKSNMDGRNGYVRYLYPPYFHVFCIYPDLC
jgi:hypothetical protein